MPESVRLSLSLSPLLSSPLFLFPPPSSLPSSPSHDSAPVSSTAAHSPHLYLSSTPSNRLLCFLVFPSPGVAREQATNVPSSSSGQSPSRPSTRTPPLTSRTPTRRKSVEATSVEQSLSGSLPLLPSSLCLLLFRSRPPFPFPPPLRQRLTFSSSVSFS
jgi:hypothetical protein